MAQYKFCECPPNENGSHLGRRFYHTRPRLVKLFRKNKYQLFSLGLLTDTPKFSKIGHMKNKELQKILGLLFKAYVIYSISADILVIGGIIYLVIRGF